MNELVQATSSGTIWYAPENANEPYEVNDDKMKSRMYYTGVIFITLDEGTPVMHHVVSPDGRVGYVGRGRCKQL